MLKRPRGCCAFSGGLQDPSAANARHSLGDFLTIAWVSNDQQRVSKGRGEELREIRKENGKVRKTSLWGSKKPAAGVASC